MLPWLQSNFNFPLSGNVTQEIEPDWFFGTIDPEAGDSETEKEIFFKVASYGKQLGMITEVLLSIADELQVDSKNVKSLSELRELQAKIESIKASKKNRLKDNAKLILDKLKNCDPEALRKLLKEYENNL